MSELEEELKEFFFESMEDEVRAEFRAINEVLSRTPHPRTGRFERPFTTQEIEQFLEDNFLNLVNAVNQLYNDFAETEELAEVLNSPQWIREYLYSYVVFPH